MELVEGELKHPTNVRYICLHVYHCALPVLCPSGQR